jgi:hypothetical protein
MGLDENGPEADAVRHDHDETLAHEEQFCFLLTAKQPAAEASNAQASKSTHLGECEQNRKLNKSLSAVHRERADKSEICGKEIESGSWQDEKDCYSISQVELPALLTR